MVAYQFHGKIFYRVYKEVEAGTEFLVWYGEQYARELDIALDDTPEETNTTTPGNCKYLIRCWLNFGITGKQFVWFLSGKENY